MRRFFLDIRACLSGRILAADTLVGRLEECRVFDTTTISEGPCQAGVRTPANAGVAGVR